MPVFLDEDGVSGRRKEETTEDAMTADVKWPRKLTKSALRARGIYNTYDLLMRGEPAIGYYPAQARTVTPACWRVWRRDVVIPNQPWYDCGGKSFLTDGNEWRKESLADAKAWASKEFKIAEWTRNPFGDWVPASVIARLNGGQP